LSAEVPQPPRKNPLLRTRLPTLPPWQRSRVALGITSAAAEGRFELQHCSACGTVQYPPREACCRCLSDQLAWRPVDGSGELLAHTQLEHSHDLYFRERVPWRVGLVRLDCGPVVVAHLHGGIGAPGVRLRVMARLDRAGMGVLVAMPEKGRVHMADDPQLREMTCDPRLRKVLVTDGKTAVGQSLVRALHAAGAAIVWVGHAEPWKRTPAFDALASLSNVTLVPLDLTDSQSVQELGATIGAKVDIVINNAEHHRAAGIAARQGTELARAEMDVNYFGLLRLAQAFGPVMRARGADGGANAVAWLNVLSIYALNNFPPHGTYSASKAAAYSLAQCLRAEMRSAGIRVINVFPGPVDDEWNQLVPPPKLAPEALAKACVHALREGLEDVYPGDGAEEWRSRWRADPKVLEREIAASS
jgi:NAD(P)-dependent dehydrogenase (short-subunit alcohol dehydrogenase family)